MLLQNRGKNEKITIIFLSICCFLCNVNVFAQDVYAEPSKHIILASGNEQVIINGDVQQITAPITVKDNVYVDIGEMGDLLGISHYYVNDSPGYFELSKYSVKLRYMQIKSIDDLDSGRFFFAFDGHSYVSVKDLAEIARYNYINDGGIITLAEQGGAVNYDRNIHEINDIKHDIEVSSEYSPNPEYVINPYKAYTYENMMTDVDKLKKMYPKLIKTDSIGTSVEGRELLLIKFGTGEKKLFVCGTHHAREYISTTYLMYAIDRFAYSYTKNESFGTYNLRDLLSQVTFYIVPMVNPDGVNLVVNGINSVKDKDFVSKLPIRATKHSYRGWKANINGVDLNWNYDIGWWKGGYKTPGSDEFHGYSTASEPETQAMKNVVHSEVFEAFISFHTQGQVYYWADDKDSPTYINQKIRSDTGFTSLGSYTYKNYYSAGSFFDYVYVNFGKPSMTVELCKYYDNCPYPDKDFDKVWSPAKNILLIFGQAIAER